MGRNLEVGDEVVDKEAEDPKKAVVVLTPDATIASWEVNEGETVADHNPGYDETAPVVVVAFVEDLDDWWDDWREYEPYELFDEMCERGHKFYAFPSERLRKTSDLDAVEYALREAGFPTERLDDRVVVEKFGEYVVREDGTVEGEGSVARNVERVVESVLS
jgi:hypothetical protein